jgi:hypothetical protein
MPMALIKQNRLISQNSVEAIATTFESIRNTIACSFVFVISLIIQKHPKLSIFGSDYVIHTSLIVALISGLLFMLNMLATLQKLIGLSQNRTKKYLTFLVAVAIGLAILNIMLLGGAVLFYTGK